MLFVDSSIERLRRRIVDVIDEFITEFDATRSCGTATSRQCNSLFLYHRQLRNGDDDCDGRARRFSFL